MGSRHYLPTGDNVESVRSAFQDGPRVGDHMGGHMYRCLGLFRGFDFALKEEMFPVRITWKGRHIAVAKLVARLDGSHLVAASAYGPTTVMRRAELCEDLK